MPAEEVKFISSTSDKKLTISQKPVIEGDYLYELDKVTQDVVGLIMDHQRNSGGGGGTLPVKESEVVRPLPFQCHPITN